MDLVVGASESALKFLLRKLGGLLAQEYTRNRGVAGDLQFIKDKLTIMQSFLDDIGEAGDGGHDHRMNDLMMQFRALAYDIEVCIRDPGQRIHTPHWLRQDKICCYFLDSSFLLTWRPRRDIANKIAKLKMCVQQMAAAKLVAAVEGEEQPSRPGVELSNRAAQLETGEPSRLVLAAVVKDRSRTADRVKGKGSSVVKVDQLQAQRTKAVVVQAPRETTTAVVEPVAEAESSSRTKRTITSWHKGQHLGSGSYGSVYEEISDDGFFFAVKEVSLVDQGRILQLEHEISLLSRLEHENIVQYLGTGKDGGKLYIFLELGTQGSLKSLYRKYHLQDSQVSAYTRQILNGLHYLHQRNVLHRDIKCANILVDASGMVKLADFGLAKEMSILSQANSSKGTVYWMAPEVAKAEPHGPPADIWSLGCTVLEMLTRKVPYPDMEWAPALLKIGRGIPPEIPNTLSENARGFIEKCVQVNPDDRPSAAELLEHPFVQRPLQQYGS